MNLSWILPSEKSNVHLRVIQNNTLEITNITRDHGGYYECFFEDESDQNSWEIVRNNVLFKKHMTLFRARSWVELTGKSLLLCIAMCIS